MSRWPTLFVSAWLAASLAGCPEPSRPREPTDAQPCEGHEDCNCDGQCGALNACVDGFCETGRSLLVPCRDGQRARPDACDM